MVVVQRDHYAEVLDRVERLRQMHQESTTNRIRTRLILDGGRGAVVALLGDKLKEQDLPGPHLIDSGMQRLAQKLGRRPDIKVDARADKDTQTERYRAEKRQRIAEGYDFNSEMELQLPQAARYIAGYGFVAWVIRSRKDNNGFHYPHAELRDPFDVYPGYWSGDNQPSELAIARRVDREWLKRNYPGYVKDLDLKGGSYYSTLAVYQGTNASSWDTTKDGAVVVEYYDDVGTWLIAYETGTLLEFSPNPLITGPRFVVAKRYTFNKIAGQYDQSWGMLKMIMQMNMMSVIATQDSTFRETNIIGRIESGKYKRGRGAYNFFEPGTRIERPTGEIAFQTFQQIDRLERQLRVQSNYNEIDDGQSPNSFATGQGLDKLTGGTSDNIAEYQLQLKYALQRLDSKRLEWDETMYPDVKKPLELVAAEGAVVEKYKPSKDIKGNYRTRRIYGVMAGWDEPAKIVTGLQLLQGRVIDRLTMQENLYGLDKVSQINERNTQQQTEDGLFETLVVQAQQGDQAARMALIEIAKNPKNKFEVLEKFFTPQEPQMSPEEQAIAAGGQPPGVQAGVPDAVTSILSRLEQGGNVEGGAQTVGQLGA